MSVALRRLKVGTAALHREAERHVRILDPDATERTYARYLSRMLGFHAPMEDAFARHVALAEIGFDARARGKRHLLDRDLTALGAPTRVELCSALPPVDALPQALGAAYVIEGSTLGGPFILSRLNARLRALVGSATAFLEGYRTETGPMWRRFAAITERTLEGSALEAAVESARVTFARLIAWLDETPADPPHPFRARVPA